MSFDFMSKSSHTPRQTTHTHRHTRVKREGTFRNETVSAVSFSVSQKISPKKKSEAREESLQISRRSTKKWTISLQGIGAKRRKKVLEVREC